MMLFVVAYDVSDDGRRARLARFLGGYGERVQYSVFECDLDERRARRMLRELPAMVFPGDGLRVYSLGENPAPRVQVHGGKPRTENPKVILA